HDDRFRREGGGDGGNALGQAVDVERHRVGVAGDVGVDDLLQFVGLTVVVEQGARVHADLPVDDEFQPRQADAGVWRAGEVERPLRVADVHHDLGADFRHFVQRYFVDTKVNLAVIDIAGITLGAGYRDAGAVGQHAAGVAAADHGRNAQFAGDDG